RSNIYLKITSALCQQGSMLLYLAAFRHPIANVAVMNFSNLILSVASPSMVLNTTTTGYIVVYAAHMEVVNLVGVLNWTNVSVSVSSARATSNQTDIEVKFLACNSPIGP